MFVLLLSEDEWTMSTVSSDDLVMIETTLTFNFLTHIEWITNEKKAEVEKLKMEPVDWFNHTRSGLFRTTHFGCSPNTERGHCHENGHYSILRFLDICQVIFLSFVRLRESRIFYRFVILFFNFLLALHKMRFFFDAVEINMRFKIRQTRIFFQSFMNSPQYKCGQRRSQTCGCTSCINWRNQLLCSFTTVCRHMQSSKLLPNTVSTAPSDLRCPTTQFNWACVMPFTLTHARSAAEAFCLLIWKQGIDRGTLSFSALSIEISMVLSGGNLRSYFIFEFITRSVCYTYISLWSTYLYCNLYRNLDVQYVCFLCSMF